MMIQTSLLNQKSTSGGNGKKPLIPTPPKKGVAMDFSDFFVESPSAASRTDRKRRGPAKQRKALPAKPSPNTKNKKSITLNKTQNDATFLEWFNRTLNPYMEWNNFTKSTGGAHGHLARLRYQQRHTLHRESKRIWQSPEMKNMRTKIRDEISHAGFRFREDFDLHRNLTLRKRVLSLLSAYDTEWLRLALETIFDEAIVPSKARGQSTRKLSDGMKLPSLDTDGPMQEDMKTTMRRFIVERVLTDSQVLYKYTKGRCKVVSMKFEAKYKAEIHALVLYRLLVIVLFLDRAKSKDILAKRLFVANSKINTTTAFLLAFCRDFLAAEGNFLKHIGKLGIEVFVLRHDPIEEIDFVATKLQTDFSNGYLLARLTEVVTDTSFKSNLRKLKQPGKSLVQKLHNIKFALDFFIEHGVALDEKITAPDIADGKQPAIRSLLWNLALRFSLGVVDPKAIEREIKTIGGEHRDEQDSNIKRRDHAQENYFEGLFHRWTTAVGSQYGVTLKGDLEADFADGVLWCLLIHHYLPNSIKLADIRPTAQSTLFMKAEDDAEKARKNERSNMHTVRRVTSSLGGLGLVVPMSDSANPPDKRVVLLALAHLFSRILACRREEVASRTIQRAMRRSLASISHKRYLSANAIACLWRKHKSQMDLDVDIVATRKRRSLSFAAEERDSINQRRKVSDPKVERPRLACDPSAEYSGVLADHTDPNSCPQDRHRSLSYDAYPPSTLIDGSKEENSDSNKFDSMVSNARQTLWRKLMAPQSKRDPPGRKMDQSDTWEGEDIKETRVEQNWVSSSDSALEVLKLVDPTQKGQSSRSRKPERIGEEEVLEHWGSLPLKMSHSSNLEIGRNTVNGANGSGAEGLDSLHKLWKDLQIGWKEMKDQ